MTRTIAFGAVVVVALLLSTQTASGAVEPLFVQSLPLGTDGSCAPVERTICCFLPEVCS
jgi:hypothetical protein